MFLVLIEKISYKISKMKKILFISFSRLLCFDLFGQNCEELNIDVNKVMAMSADRGGFISLIVNELRKLKYEYYWDCIMRISKYSTFK